MNRSLVLGKGLAVLSICALTLVGVATGVWASGDSDQAPAAEREMVVDVWGQEVEKPRYGGTIPVAIGLGAETYDPWYTTGPSLSYWTHLVFDRPGDLNFALPRDTVPYLTSRFLDISHMTGGLAEGWEQPDLTTYVFRIREGVRWHDKPPVNGRALTAHDVVWTWHRNFGLGEFADMGASQHMARFVEAVPVESVTAPDDYTVVVKTSSFSFVQIEELLMANDNGTAILPREAVEQHGDFKDWQNVVGSGPYEISDAVLGASTTFSRNPNYWKTDPLLPDLQNQLPYADEIQLFVIRDKAALAAALRTGKTALAGGKHLSLDTAKSLTRTNPELVAIRLIGTQAGAAAMRADQPPFDNKMVRVAIQQAVDRDEINEAYFEGDADVTPYGYVTTAATGRFFAFDELSDEVKRQYEYDPEEAERLLDEAGYPRGDDGIRFSIGWDVALMWGEDTDLAILVSSYLDKVGVDITVHEHTDEPTYWNSLVNGDVNRMAAGAVRHAQWNPFYIGFDWASPLDDPSAPGNMSAEVNEEMNALWKAINETTDFAEYSRLIREMDRIYLTEHWTLAVAVTPLFMLHQPWLKGYRGELAGALERYTYVLPNAWVDVELKQEMGH
jgi:peptide/nickel transport system substrate-binding protein